MDNHHIERRQVITLTQDQMNYIAERASERALERLSDKIDIEIGRAFRKKSVWLITIIGLGAYMWLVSHGFIDNGLAK